MLKEIGVNMPTYEYKCKNCEKEFDVVQSIMDDALTACPTCEGSVQRLISRNVGIQFKGSGFYVNDSVNSSTNKKNKSTKEKTKNKSDKLASSTPAKS